MLRHEIMNTVWPCADRVAHERVLRLQVEDVVLVDARRHDDERAPVHASPSSARTGSARSARCGRRRCPGVTARLRPTSNARSSVIEMRPLREVARRGWRGPARGSRPRSRARASAPRDWSRRNWSVRSRRRTAASMNARRCLSCSGSGGERGELGQVCARRADSDCCSSAKYGSSCHARPAKRRSPGGVATISGNAVVRAVGACERRLRRVPQRLPLRPGIAR